MIEFVLSDPDLLSVRFAVSPLNELTLSLRPVNDPAGYPLHLPWARRVWQLRDLLDMPVLDALTNDRGWTPDFLSPRPVSPLTRVEDEFAQLRRTPPEVVAQDLRRIHARVPRVLTGEPAAVLERIIGALEGYWHHAFADSWERMRNLLEADVVYRGRVMTQSGLNALLLTISDRVTFDSPVIRIRIDGVAPRRVETRGAGLTLVPTLFARRTAVPVNPSAPPMLLYAARAVGTLWERPQVIPAAGLAGLLGRARAEILVMLTEPVSSTELAGRLRVTTSAANQHLRALRDGGLVTSYRHGRSMLYARTTLGDAMCGGDERGRAQTVPG